MPGNLTGRQLEGPAQSADHDPELEELIHLYLHGEYEVESPGAPQSDVIRLDIDDITAIRAAKRLAGEIRAVSDGGSDQVLSHSITGSVLRFLIGDVMRAAGMSPDLPSAELAGGFMAMLVESFMARVRLHVQPQTIAIPSRWSGIDQQAFVRLSERLWRYGDLAGLSRPELDPLGAEAAIRTMALQYTVAHFTHLEPHAIDVLALSAAAGRIERHVQAEIQRTQR